MPVAAEHIVSTTLSLCQEAGISGRERLAVIRDALLKQGVAHKDTRELCQQLGFEVRGLTVDAPKNNS